MVYVYQITKECNCSDYVYASQVLEDVLLDMSKYLTYREIKNVVKDKMIIEKNGYLHLYKEYNSD